MRSVQIVLFLPLLFCVISTAANNILGEDGDDVEVPRESAAAREFREWCRQAEIDVHPDIRIGVPTDRAGRGVLAAADLERGSPLLAVPLGSMLTVEHAVVDERFASLWSALPDLPDSDLLAAYLASEAVRETGKHAGYLKFLPSEAQDALHLGDRAMELLKASPVYPRLEARLRKMEEALKDIVVAAGKGGHHVAVHRLRKALDMDTFKWAHSMLRSRSHKVSVKDDRGEWQDAMAMIPVADMFNTEMDDDAVNVACFTGEEGWGPSSIFYCQTTRDVAAGDELLVSYFSHPSRRTNGNTFLEYGFVPDQNSFDAIPLQLPEASKEASKLLKMLHLDARVSVLPLLKDTAQFDDLNFVLHHSSRVLSKMFKNVAGWSPTKIQIHVSEPHVRMATYVAVMNHLDSVIDAYPEALDAFAAEWDVALVSKLLLSEIRILKKTSDAAAFAHATFEEANAHHI